MLLVLPLLCLPFVALLFFALGGGKGAAVTASLPADALLNTELPSAQLNDDGKMDKLGYYRQAEADSNKWRDQLKQDPYSKSALLPRDDWRLPAADSIGLSYLPFDGLSAVDAQERAVQGKLAQLQDAIQAPQAPLPTTSKPLVHTVDDVKLQQLSALVDQVHSAPEGDSELTQLSGMLDKIMAIQHPASMPPTPAASPVVPVAVHRPRGSVFPVSRLDTTQPASSIRFYGPSGVMVPDTLPVSLTAVVHAPTALVNGAKVKLRITQAFVLNRVLIPRDQFVYATAQVSSDCIQLTVSSLSYAGHIFPVSFAVYDGNGLPCIPVNGTLTSGALQQSAGQSMQGFGALSPDASLVGQAAGTGLQAARHLFSNKVKLVKVHLAAGHSLLLIPKQQRS